MVRHKIIQINLKEKPIFHVCSGIWVLVLKSHIKAFMSKSNYSKCPIYTEHFYCIC